MIKSIISLFVIVLIVSCGDSKKQNTGAEYVPYTQRKAATDDGKGVGEIKNVQLNDPLNQDMVDRGKAIYDLKCAACHKLSGSRIVGPSWEGLTTKRKPEWLMNMITNVEVMLEEDAEARKLLEECLTRMPNQNVSIEDSRDILEYMYFNDKELANK